jgi:hypothetical protein
VIERAPQSKGVAMFAHLNFKSMVLSAAVLGTMSLASGQVNADCSSGRQVYRSAYTPAPVYRYRSGYQAGPAYLSAPAYSVGGPRMWSSPSYRGGMQFESYRRSLGKP